MKKVVKFVFGLLMIVVIFMKATKVNAEDLKSDNIRFSIDNYDEDEVDIIYYNQGNKRICDIKDKDSGKLIETVSLEPDYIQMFIQRKIPKEGMLWVGPHTFRELRSFGRTNVQISIPVELYNEGSFRQVNYIGNPYLGITNSITTTKIESSSCSAWGKNNRLPATTMFYAYYGTLVAEVSGSASTGISAELLGSGFSFSHTIGTTKYYRRPINDSGTFNLYQTSAIVRWKTKDLSLQMLRAYFLA